MSPFTSIYAIELGASATEMGWFRSLNNLFANIMQIPWGILSDKFRKRVYFIILGGILTALFWLPMIYVRNSHELLFLVASQAFVGSMVSPAWSALIGDMVHQSVRGTVTATINAAASAGSIFATLLSGYIMEVFGSATSSKYTIPLILATVCGIIASLTMFTLREPRGIRTQRYKGIKSILKENTYFRTFCYITILHSFFMTMAWPIFPITTVKVTGGNTVQIAYLSAVQGSVSLIVRRFVGRLADRAGRKPLIIFGRAGIVVVPIIYAIATNVYYLYAVDFTVGVLASASEIAVFAYLLDIVPEDKRAASIALYNTINGFSTFFGSLTGGYMADLALSIGFGSEGSLQFVYAISAVGRLACGLLFMKIKEPYKYPSTVKREIEEMMHEDSERIKKGIEEIEEKGEIAEESLKKDLEWFENLLGPKEDKEKRQ
ncbi:MFS transporter [Candidatus Bathyarchaeota archaeon]|nr:MFS transporter [Candidatus Bathyarchaeota archaeon]